MAAGRLAGRVAVVTGGTRGFGRATAELFAAEGATVAIWYRVREIEAQQVCAALESAGADALALRVDVSDFHQVDAAASQVADRFGKIDILMNSAGVLRRGAILENNPSAWQGQIQTNIWGTINTSTSVAPYMVTQGYGRIINVASAGAQQGWENGAVYAGTKAFVVAYTKSLALELGRYGITVNCIGPAGIITDMNRDQYTQEWTKQREESLPVRHLGKPADVAYVALTFADEAAEYLTGQILYPTGGGTMGI
jgi:3-oxoacyl-[acyl-carrier protein] reductase